MNPPSSSQKEVKTPSFSSVDDTVNRSDMTFLVTKSVNLVAVARGLCEKEVLTLNQLEEILSQSNSVRGWNFIYEIALRKKAFRELELVLASSGNDDVVLKIIQRIVAAAPLSTIEKREAPLPSFNHEFEFVEEIGFGAFGRVIQAIGRSTGTAYAIKILRLTGKKGDDKIGREVQLLKDLNYDPKNDDDDRSKFIIKIVNSWREPVGGTMVENGKEFLKSYQFHFPLSQGDEVRGLFFIQMEYCAKGNLQYWIQRHNWEGRQTPENFKQVQIWFEQVATGLSFLHDKKIWHRDLKPSNILLMTLDSGEVIVKIADFGESRYLPGEDQELTRKVGTDFYMSPEVLSGGTYDEKADIYSLGVVLTNLIRPMKDTDGRETLTNYYEFLDGPQRHILPHDFVTQFYREAHLIKRMLAQKPGARPDARQVLTWCKDEGWGLVNVPYKLE